MIPLGCIKNVTRAGGAGDKMRLHVMATASAGTSRSYLVSPDYENWAGMGVRDPGRRYGEGQQWRRLPAKFSDALYAAGLFWLKVNE